LLTSASNASQTKQELESRSQTCNGLLLANLIVGVLWAGWRTPVLIGQDDVSIFFFSFYAVEMLGSNLHLSEKEVEMTSSGISNKDTSEDKSSFLGEGLSEKQGFEEGIFNARSNHRKFRVCSRSDNPLTDQAKCRANISWPLFSCCGNWGQWFIRDHQSTSLC
jgi:hypothetical protein